MGWAQHEVRPNMGVGSSWGERSGFITALDAAELGAEGA
jgi:hypothetical protein